MIAARAQICTTEARVRALGLAEHHCDQAPRAFLSLEEVTCAGRAGLRTCGGERLGSEGRGGSTDFPLDGSRCISAAFACERDPRLLSEYRCTQEVRHFNNICTL